MLTLTVPSLRSSASQPLNGAFSQDGIPADSSLVAIGQRLEPFSGRQILHSPNSADSTTDQGLEEKLKNMSSKDRWGLPGFFAAFQDPVRHRLIRGETLDSLGMRIDTSEPLHQKFLGPFASSQAVPRPLDTDWSLPACYEIKNVVPLQQRVPSFTEETLFYIFYTMPRDIMQEIVAEELMGRKWRFHIPQKMWLTRDENAPPPVEVDPGVSESGTYLCWNPKEWKRQRVQFILKYEELDHLPRGERPVAGNGFNPIPSLERMVSQGMGRSF